MAACLVQMLLVAGADVGMVLGLLDALLQRVDERILHRVGVVQPRDHYLLVGHRSLLAPDSGRQPRIASGRQRRAQRRLSPPPAADPAGVTREMCRYSSRAQ